MPALPILADHTAGLLAALVAGLAVPVGDGDAEALDPPYVVLYRLSGGVSDGPITDPDIDVEIPYQLTSVARTSAAAEYLADQARAAAQTLTVAGRRVLAVYPLPASPPVEKEDEVHPLVFVVKDRIRVATTPA